MPITENQIIETAETLDAAGVNPTQVTVREALGGGSFATIGPVLKRWKESRQQEHELVRVQVPEPVSERVEQLKGAAWQAAVEEAERRLQAERQALTAARESAEQEAIESQEAVKTLEAELEQQRQALTAERYRASQVEKAAQEATQAAAELKALLEGAQRELEQSRARMKQLEAKTEQAQGEAAELRGELRAYRATQKSKTTA